jgi:hypothetical protein
MSSKLKFKTQHQCMTWHGTCPTFHIMNMEVTGYRQIRALQYCHYLHHMCKWNFKFTHNQDIANELYHAGNAMCWGTLYVRVMKWYVKWVQHWPYQPSAEQQMQTICGTLATCPLLALQGWESVDASSWCVGDLPPDVTDCSVLLTGPDLWYHLPTPSLLCTDKIISSGSFI